MPTPDTRSASPPKTDFREIVAAIHDCADRILRGDDPGHLWTTTLQSHATVIAQDFDCFGDPVGSEVSGEVVTVAREEIELIKRFASNRIHPGAMLESMQRIEAIADRWLASVTPHTPEPK